MLKINSYENKLLIILFFCFGFVFFDRLALSFLFPFIAVELNLNNTHLGLLSSTLALMWAISGATLGAYSDHKANKKYLLMMLVIAFSVLSALTGTVASFASLLLLRALIGVAEGPVLPISQSLLAAASTPNRRGLNMGLVNASAPGLLGAVIAPPLLIYIATTNGWRNAFYLSCIPGLIMAFFIWKYVKNPDVLTMPSADKIVTPAKKYLYRDILKHRNILICIMISCFYISWFITLISFTPTFLISVKHFSPMVMGEIMSCFGLAWVIWGFMVSALSDRIGRKPTLIIFSTIATLCPIVLLYTHSAQTMMPLVFLTYTGLGCFTLFMATIPAETVAPAQIASALGLIMGIGELFGGFITPTLAGIAADHYGLPVVMWIAAAGSAISTLLSFFLSETAPARLGMKAMPRDTESST